MFHGVYVFAQNYLIFHVCLLKFWQNPEIVKGSKDLNVTAALLLSPYSVVFSKDRPQK